MKSSYTVSCHGAEGSMKAQNLEKEEIKDGQGYLFF